MRDYQIKLEPFTFIALKDLKIIQEVNHHAAAEIAVHMQACSALPDLFIFNLLNNTAYRINLTALCNAKISISKVSQKQAWKIQC